MRDFRSLPDARAQLARMGFVPPLGRRGPWRNESTRELARIEVTADRRAIVTLSKMGPEPAQQARKGAAPCA